MTTTEVIYGLIDPRTGELRYIGKTGRSIKERIREHIDAALREISLPVSLWIRECISDQCFPEIFEIEQVAREEVKEAERFWVSYFRSLGARLTNSYLLSGQGCPTGLKRSAETRLRMSIAQRIRYSDPIKRAKMGLRHKGKVISQQQRERQSAAMKRAWARRKELQKN